MLPTVEAREDNSGREKLPLIGISLQSSHFVLLHRAMVKAN
jgi:hypothetical protein